MPSPVGHSMLGLAVGLGYLLPRAPWREWLAGAKRLLMPLLLFIYLANAPDVDYLFGLLSGQNWNTYHQGHTHTLGWVVMVTVGLWAIIKWRRPATGWVLLLVMLLAMTSHLAADLLTEDARAPFGIMLFWPFSSERWIAPQSLFLRMEKDAPLDALSLHNLRAVLVELAWTFPIVAAVLFYKLVPISARSCPRTKPPIE